MSELENLYNEKMTNVLEMPDEDVVNVYKEFRQLALEDRDKLVSLLHSVDLCSDNHLWEVYDCLREEAGQWKDVLVAETVRLMDAAQKSPKSASKILESLEGISASSDTGYLKSLKIEFSKHFHSPVLGLRRRIVWEFCNCSEKHDESEIRLIQECLLNDSDWRVRSFARQCLVDSNDLPNQYSEPLLDRIYRKLFNNYVF